MSYVTPEIINELSAQIVEMTGKLRKLKCDGTDFDDVASKLADVNTSLRLAHSRYERGRIAKKQTKAPRQARLDLG